MKKIHIIMCTIIILGIQAIQTTAQPSMNGPTGLITMPTAESLQYKEVNLAIDYNFYNDATGNGSVYEYYYKLNIGALKNWELGIIGGTNPSEGVYVNAKYYLISDNTRYPLSLAIGCQNLTSKSLNSIYLVASQKFEGGLSGHLGFNYKMSNQDAAIMLGTEYYINNNLSILGDLEGQNKGYILNAGLRLAIAPDIIIRLSALDISQIQKPTSISIGVSIARFL